MKRKIILSFVTSTFLLTGCVQRDNNIFKSQVTDGLKDSKNINIKRHIKQIFVKNSFIDFSINQDLKSALNTLSKLDKYSIYLLANGSKDIIFPPLTTQDSKKLKINSFEKLKKFIEKTTPYTLIITTNPFQKGIKIVKVINRTAVKNDIEKYPFAIHGKYSLKNLFTEISKITGYSVIFKNDNNHNFQSSATPLSNTSPSQPVQAVQGGMPPQPLSLSNKTINFQGNNIGDFLNYISNEFNYFVTIDYQDKLIIFKKTKLFTFPLDIPNINTKLSTSLNKSSNNSSTNNNDLLQFNYTNNFILNFIKSLKAFAPNANINYSAGVIYANLTKNQYQVLSKIINNFNVQFNKKVELKFDVYVFLINKNYNIGTDFNIKTKYLNAVTHFLNSSILTAKNIPTTTFSKSGNINLGNTFMRFVKHYSFEHNIINNIPFIDNLNTETNYIESIQTTTTTGTATSTSTQTNIGKINQGEEFIIFPKIYSDKIFLRMLFKTSTLNSLEEKKIGNNIIMLPSVSIKNIPVNINLRFGEKRIAGIIQTFTNANQFKGIVPLEGFILGGNNSHNYVRELIAVVVSAQKVK